MCAHFHSPRIVTNGLVLALDAANAKSFVSDVLEVEYLIVGGGGGGGMDMGGGGGGGGVLTGTAYSVTAGTPITVTVGAGGNGAPAAGTNGQPANHQYTIPATSGSNSVFGSLTAIGGGFGGSSYRGYTPGITGGSGGSGGGASGYNDNAGTFNGGSGTEGQGFRGGNSTQAYYSGGGGGAGGPGADSTNQPNGGPGILNHILGTSYYWGGGGGGASYSLATGGNGGIGGGGGGAVGTTTGGAGYNNGSPGGGGSPNSQTNTPGGNAGANTGGGGGGGSHYNSNNKGGDGGSGIVVVRYGGPQKATGGTITTVGGDTVHTFTSSGTFEVGNFWGDISLNENSGELVNGPTFNSGNLGSLSFDGSNDNIQLAGTNFSLNTMTISAWNYSSNYQQNGFMFEKTTNGSVNTQYSLFYNSGNNSIYYRTYGLSILDLIVNRTTAGVVNNQWNNVVATWDGTNKRIYVNGVLRATSATLSGTVTQNTTGAAFIGIYGGGGYPFNGRISQTQIYNRALTAAEVLQNFNATKSRYGL